MPPKAAAPAAAVAPVVPVEEEGPPPPPWFKPIPAFVVGIVFPPEFDAAPFFDAATAISATGVEVLGSDALLATAADDEALNTRVKEEQAAGQVSSALKGEVLSAYRLKDATKVPPPPAADGETALQQLQRQKDRPHKLVLLNSVCSSTEEWVGFGSISSGIDLLVEVSVPVAHSEDIPDSRPPTAHASVIPLVSAVAAADSGDNRGWNDTKLASVDVEPANEEKPWAAALLERIAVLVSEQVAQLRAYHKFNHAATLRAIPVASEAADSRHYNRVLSDVPCECVGVAMVLHAVLQQVCLSCSDGVTEDDFTAAAEAAAIAAMFEAASFSLPLAGMPQKVSDIQRGGVIWAGDSLSLRLSTPGISSVCKSVISCSEQRYRGCVTLPVWSEVGQAALELGVEATELAHFTREGSSAAAVARGLLLMELEALVGHGTDANGKPLHPNSCSLQHFVGTEDISADVIQQRLADALISGRELVMRYFARLDAQLIVAGYSVPFTRSLVDQFSSGDLCYQGFVDWLKLPQAKSVLELPDYATSDNAPEAVVRRSLPEKNNRPWVDERVYTSNGVVITKHVGPGGDFITLASLQRTCRLLKKVDQSFSLSHAWEDGANATLSGDISGQGLALNIAVASGVAARIAHTGRILLHPAFKSASSGGVDWVKHNASLESKVPVGTIQMEGNSASTRSASSHETRRIVLEDGSVVVFYLSGSVHILSPDGAISVKSVTQDGDIWTRTSAAGDRQQLHPDGRLSVLPSIRAVKVTDAQTREVVSTRDDLVVAVQRADGTRIVLHADGTEIVTQSSGAVEISSRGYAGVELGSQPLHRKVFFLDGTIADFTSAGLLLQRPDGSSVTCRVDARHAVVQELCDGEGELYDARVLDWYDSIRGNDLAIKEAKVTLPKPRVGVYFFDLHTGEVEAVDSDGNAFIFDHKMNNRSKVRRHVDFEAAREAVIVANEAARMRSGGDSEGQSALPLEPGPVLQPLQLFVRRRDGNGQQLYDQPTVEGAVLAARRRGASIQKIPMPANAGGGTAFVCTQNDPRFTAAAASRESDLPLYLRYKTPSAPGTVGACLAQRFILVKGLGEAGAAALRKSVQQHKAWAANIKAEIDGIVTPETRSDAEVAAAQELAAQLRDARAATPNWHDPFHGLPPVESESQLSKIVSDKPQSRSKTAGVAQGTMPRTVNRSLNATDEGGLRPNYFEAGVGKAFAAEHGDHDAAAKVAKRQSTQHVEQDHEQQHSAGGVSHYLQPDDDAEEDFRHHVANGDANGGIQEQTRAKSVVLTDHRGEKSRSHSKLSKVESAAGTQKTKKPAARPVVPSLLRDTAPSEPNYEELELEEGVRRKVNTLTVSQKRMLEESKSGYEPVSFKCTPSEVDFGTVAQGKVVCFKVVLHNFGNDPCRFRVVQPHAAYIRVEYTPGQVAPGMACSLQVKLSASHLGTSPLPPPPEPVVCIALALAAADTYP
jgi:hypothetical protein